MQVASMLEAQSRFTQLVAAAEAGEEVIITRDGQPVVRLVSVGADAPARRFGALAGQVTLTDAFFEPLPDVERDAWEG